MCASHAGGTSQRRTSLNIESGAAHCGGEGTPHGGEQLADVTPAK